MNGIKSGSFWALVAIMVFIMASSAFSLPLMAFKPVSTDINPISVQATQPMQSSIRPSVDDSAAIPATTPVMAFQPVARRDVARVPSTPVIDTTSSPTLRVPVGPGIPGPSIPVHIPGDDASDDSGDDEVPVLNIPVVDRVPVNTRVPPLAGSDVDDSDDADEIPTPDVPHVPYVPVTSPARTPIFHPIPKQDIAVTYFASDRARAAYGETVNFKFMVVNQGDGYVTFRYSFYPSVSPGSIVGSISNELTLASGESRIVTLSHTYNKPCASVVQAKIVVDSDRRVSESDESNNEASLKIWLYDQQVVTPPVVNLPDLGIDVLTSLTAEVGETAIFDVYLVNDDSTHTVVTYFNYEFGDGASGAVGPITLGPKVRVVERVSHVYTSAGRKAFTAMVDPANVIVERVETNNRATLIINVEEHVTPVLPACSDGIDNDQDTLVDMADPGCDSVQDNDETDPVIQPACNDQLDNDGDGSIDMADSGCDSVVDTDEYVEVGPGEIVFYKCSDGADNDMDGLVDMADPGCESATDSNEFNEVIVIVPDTNETGNETGNQTGNETGDVENIAPFAVLSVTPLDGTAPLNVTIDGSASHDDDGMIEQYSWVITGPSGYLHAETDVEGTPGSMVREFVVAGEYSIMLIVADDDGAVSDSTVHVVLTGVGGSDTGSDTNTTGNQTTTGNETTTGNQTGDSTTSSAPTISSRSVTSITSSSAIIKWRTNINADAKLEYGTDDDDLDDDKSASGTRTSHSITIDSLDAQTKYYYKITSCANGKCTEVGPYSFTTLMAGSSTSDEDDEDTDDEETDSEDSYVFDDNSGASVVSTTRSTGAVDFDSVEESSDVLAGAGVDVIFAPLQFMEVEDEVCGFKFLFWCLWHETVTRKVPIPAMTGGVEFFV